MYDKKMKEIEEYPTGYVVENDQSFNVVDGFPRIIEATSGVAEIKYSVVINSCSDFEFANDDLVGVFVND